MMDGGSRTVPRAWGAEFVRPGVARFRLWAPSVAAVTLRLHGRDAPMTRVADGWFESVVEGVEPGREYGFVLPDGIFVPDPASRAQAGDVHGSSVVVDPTGYRWKNAGWSGRPWREAMIYELHVGTFTPEGTFRAAADRLAHLAELGVTAVELMPLAQASGRRGWGYDGVLPYAPHNAYGAPDDLKHLVDTAHGLGLMMFLDVVYNHFGPDGNYLPTYAAEFFDPSRHTPWGAAIAYHRPPVRDFFMDNALYWLEEFGFDGLRFDAVDQIRDTADPEFLFEIARRIREHLPYRHIHLATEDNRNVVHLHPRHDGLPHLHTAEWNDDFHNAAHVLLTGENEGYYRDFAADPVGALARCLAEGFAYQGEPSPHAGGEARGQPSTHLPPTAFIDFLQNHDQVGNRALGERLSALVEPAPLSALTAILLLSPHIPLVFMGDEWGETRPFLFFTDFHGELAAAVREGRRREFSGFSAFDTQAERAAIPDPNAESTFLASRLDWDLAHSAEGRRRQERFRSLLALRRAHVVPLLDEGLAETGSVIQARDGRLAVDWLLANGRLQLRANLSDRPQPLVPVVGEIVYGDPSAQARGDDAPAWSVTVAIAR